MAATARVKITNRLGMHARPAMLLAEVAQEFDSDISIRRTDHEDTVDAKSIMQLMMLAATEGTELEIKAFDALVRLFIQLAPHLALNDAPIERLDMGWAGKATTNADYEQMRAIDETTSEAEIKRRFRAFG